MKDNDSYIYRRGTTPNTQVAVSQKAKIYSVSYDNSAFSQIGVMSSFATTDGRQAEPVRGVGYGDQIAELVPGVSDPISLDVTRQLLYLANAHQRFGYGGGVDGMVRALKHHQWPFDVKQELVFSRIATEENVPKLVAPASDGVNEALLTFYEACWMTSYSYEFSADSAMIQETVNITCSDIIDGSSTYGDLAADSQSTGNNPFSDSTGGSFRYSGQGTGVQTNLA